MKGYFYCATICGVGEPFERFVISLYRNAEDCSPEKVLTMAWQGTRGESKPWYAFSFEVDSRVNSVEGLVEFADLAKRLSKSYEKLTGGEVLFGYGTRPSQVAEALANLNVAEYVYDPRIRAHVPVADVAPGGFRLYVARSNGGRWVVEVLAEDEERAREMVKEGIRERMGKSGRVWDAEREALGYAEWVRGGALMSESTYWGELDARGVMEKANLHKDEVVEQEG